MADVRKVQDISLLLGFPELLLKTVRQFHQNFQGVSAAADRLRHRVHALGEKTLFQIGDSIFCRVSKVFDRVLKLRIQCFLLLLCPVSRKGSECAGRESPDKVPVGSAVIQFLKEGPVLLQALKVLRGAAREGGDPPCLLIGTEKILYGSGSGEQKLFHDRSPVQISLVDFQGIMTPFSGIGGRV